jgi:hypothetical protein
MLSSIALFAGIDCTKSLAESARPCAPILKSS